MKIGIDISQLAYQGTGVAAYTENLITNLLKIDKENEYIFFYSSLRQKLPENLKSKISNLKSSHIPPLFLEFLWNRLHILPIETFTGKLDVFHTSDWTEPPTNCPKVTTIHDLAIFKYPETFIPKGGHNIIQNQKRKLAWVKKESDIVIAVSENTKRDIVDILKIPENKIKVVYEAQEGIYEEKKSIDSVGKVKSKYGINGKYLLSVGTLEPRKNIKRVIEAYKILTSQFPEMALIICGKMGWGEEVEKWKIGNGNGEIKFLGYVPKGDLACLYQGAECFVYPSLYEGFGLPVLDAMASGCPVVTSNISSLPEVSGDAGILVNPGDVEEIAKGIVEALEKKESLAKKGLIQASKFSWEKTARETLKIYQNL
jgi:glycosyltransferase involved in cell wall biosynthesis